MRVADLLLAVDGPTAAGSGRLSLRGSSLYATKLGGCSGCPVRVKRGVLVSSRIREVAGEPYVPLADLLRAFEGRLVVERARKVYGIHVGQCSWCILEPNVDEGRREGRSLSPGAQPPAT